MSSFWMKCGKLLTDSASNLIRCRTCPCGYYGLFAFVGRYLPNGPNSTPDYCSEPSIDVAPFEVIDGKIQYSGGMGIMWSGCIEINVQADADGKVGYAKGCGSQWQDCLQWDENWENCLKYGTVYMDCYQIKVYRIGNCFQDLDQFKAFVYSKCPQYTAPYPKLWETSYGNKYTSSQASNCIYKEWDLNQDSWYSYAYYKYVPKAQFSYQLFDNSLTIYTNSTYGHEEITGSYTWCDGQCLQQGDNGCTNCNGQLITETMTNWVQDGYCHSIEKPSWGGSQIWSYTWGFCERQQNQPQCKCIDDYNSNSLKGFAQINPKVESIFSDKSEYTSSITNTVSPCFNQNYVSNYQPNECWASWWVQGMWRKWCRFAKLKIEKWHEKVEYKGVHIKIYAIDQKGCYQSSNRNPSNYPLSVSHSENILYDSQMDVYWGEQFEFPIANNMSGMSVLESGHCVNYGDYSYTRFTPHNSGCEQCQKITISIQVMWTLK